MEKKNEKDNYIGGVILIAIGVLFLLDNLGFAVNFGRFWPVILIILGVWMLIKNLGTAGR